MNASIKYLMRVLNAEMAHGKNVLAFLKEKERCLIKNDGKTFRTLVMKEQDLFLKSRDLEKSRQAVVEVLGKQIGAVHLPIRLENLIERLEGQVREDLAKIRSAFLSTLSQLKEQNEKCEILLKKTIEIVNHSIGLLAGKNVAREKMIYGKNLKINRSMYTRPLLDRQG